MLSLEQPNLAYLATQHWVNIRQNTCWVILTQLFGLSNLAMLLGCYSDPTLESFSHNAGLILHGSWVVFFCWIMYNNDNTTNYIFALTCDFIIYNLTITWIELISTSKYTVLPKVFNHPFKSLNSGVPITSMSTGV